MNFLSLTGHNLTLRVILTLAFGSRSIASEMCHMKVQIKLSASYGSKLRKHLFWGNWNWHCWRLIETQPQIIIIIINFNINKILLNVASSFFFFFWKLFQFGLSINFFFQKTSVLVITNRHVYSYCERKVIQ